jgi:hypothetical protein
MRVLLSGCVAILLVACIASAAALPGPGLDEGLVSSEPHLCAYTVALGCEYEYDEPTLVYVSSILVPIAHPIEWCRERDDLVTCGHFICRAGGIVIGDVVSMRIGGTLLSEHITNPDCNHAAGIAGVDDS